MMLGSSRKAPPTWQALTHTSIELPSIPWTVWQVADGPRTTAAIDESVVAWAEREATIVHPQRGRIGFVPYPYQRAFLDCTAPRRFVLKARQIGFSQIFALEALHTAITQEESMILLVSRNQDLAINLLRYCYQAYGNLRQPPKLTKENESELGLANGSRIKSLPANRSTGRGFAARDVYLDEFAYAAYAEDIYQSVSPAISQGGRITIGSTPNGVGNLFHTLYAGSDDFVRFRIPWHQCPAYYTPAEQAAGVPSDRCAWYERERPKYTHQQWAAEYDCDFVGSGLALFDVADLDRATQHAVGEQAPMPGHQYATYVDVGRRHDATVINTIDETTIPYQRVAFQRLERVPYPYIQSQIEARYQRYGGRLVIESNGVGDPLIENLNVRAEPFVTTAKTKLQALQALQQILERADFKAQWESRERAALVAAAWDDDHTADEIMSLAIGAFHLVHRPGQGVYL
jgi:hypothetical protein